MPTSVTGTSKSDRAGLTGPPSGRCASGFTLLEVLVVLVIIGIISGMAVLSTRVLGGDHEMDQEAQRLQAVLAQAREESMLDGRDVGLRVDRSGYDFLRFNGRLDAWEPVVGDALFRERQLPDGLNAGLRLESRDIELKTRSAPTEDAPPLPQVIVQASGDLVPFELLLSRDGTEEIRRIAGTIDGKIEVHDDTERRR
ncbi:MAG TPA: type II secretion system minor pseudopilin GspH [Steroidobacteraceae bacterium]